MSSEACVARESQDTRELNKYTSKPVQRPDVAGGIATRWLFERSLRR